MSEEPVIDFSKITTFSNGVRIINCTKHPMTFQDQEYEIVVYPCGAQLVAESEEDRIGTKCFAQIVGPPRYRETDEGLAELKAIQAYKFEAPDSERDFLVVGSIISAQAYPGYVFAALPAQGLGRVPPEHKRMRIDKFRGWEKRRL